MSSFSERHVLEVDESIHSIQKEHTHGNRYPNGHPFTAAD